MSTYRSITDVAITIMRALGPIAPAAISNEMKGSLPSMFTPGKLFVDTRGGQRFEIIVREIPPSGACDTPEKNKRFLKPGSKPTAKEVMELLTRLRDKGFHHEEIGGPAPGDTRPNFSVTVLDADIADAHDLIERFVFKGGVS